VNVWTDNCVEFIHLILRVGISAVSEEEVPDLVVLLLAIIESIVHVLVQNLDTASKLAFPVLVLTTWQCLGVRTIDAAIPLLGGDGLV